MTPRQKDVLDFIRGYIELNEYPPTLQEIADKIGTNKSNVNRLVRGLEARGKIKTQPFISRSIEVL